MRSRITPTAGLLLSLAFGLSIYHFSHGVWNSERYGFADDFPIFLQNAQLFLATGELYPFADNLESYYPAAPVYKFPPLYAVFLLPLVQDGISPYALRGHWLFQVLLYGLAAAGLLRLLRRKREFWFPAFGVLAILNFEPFFETLWRLQIETPLLVLLVLLVWSLSAGRPGVGGAAWGVATLLKVYPAFLLLYLVVRRRGRWIVWGVLSGVLILVGTLSVFGLHSNRVFYLEILPHLLKETPTVSPENTSLGRSLQIVLGAGPLVAKRALQVVALGLTAVSLWTVHRTATPSDPRRWSLELSVFVSLMVLCMPNAWANYQLLLLLPVLSLLSCALEDDRVRPGTLLVTGLAYGLLLFYAPCAGPERAWPCAQTPSFLGLAALPRPLHDLLVDLRGGAQFLLWGACLWRLRADAPRLSGASRFRAVSGAA